MSSTYHENNETEYLLKNEDNKQHLLKAIENVNNNENVVEVPLENFKLEKPL